MCLLGGSKISLCNWVSSNGSRVSCSDSQVLEITWWERTPVLAASKFVKVGLGGSNKRNGGSDKWSHADLDPMGSYVRPHAYTTTRTTSPPREYAVFLPHIHPIPQKIPPKSHAARGVPRTPIKELPTPGEPNWPAVPRPWLFRLLRGFWKDWELQPDSAAVEHTFLPAGRDDSVRVRDPLGSFFVFIWAEGSAGK